MITNYCIRAEFRDKSKRDIQVIATTLAMARTTAERQLTDLAHGALRSMDWRGQVVFVDCLPAEENIAPTAKYKQRELFARESLKKASTAKQARNYERGSPIRAQVREALQ